MKQLMMTNKNIYFLLAFLISIFYQNQVFTQSPDPDHPVCFTTGSPSNANIPLTHTVNLDPITIRIYVHVVRDQFGNGGQTAQQVKEGLRHLDIAFNPLNIFFEWDCDIDYIDNQTLFESLGLNYSVYGTNAHDDGIDLYLFPEHPFPLAAGSGHANVLNIDDFFAKELIVIGNFKLPPDYQNLVPSHILSHEVGHCLGLRHPSFGQQLLNDPQCNAGNLFTLAGDHICDTPPDPEINFDVNPNDCTWNGQQAGFDPDEKNIMALTHLNCLEEDEGESGYFTFGQGQWIRNSIATFSELQECVVATVPYDFTNPIFSSTINVSTGEISAGEYRIQGDLIIESGFTLTIEPGATLIFEKDAKLIVKQNARLNLYGTLTAGCRNTWEGVEVWSNQSLSDPKSQGYYYEDNVFVSYQGRLHTYPGSVIENAVVGVKLYENLGDGVSTKGGGVINADGTIFRNNKVGIQTAFYDNFYNHPFNPNIGGPSFHRPYEGKLSECIFETDYYYPHADSRFTFVDLKAVDGFLILGCEFTNTYEIDDCEGISEYGTGVWSHNAGFHLGAKCLASNGPFGDCIEWKRSRFNGLGYAVQSNFGTGESEDCIIKQTDFENCYIGINGRRNTMPVILHNRFYMGTLPSSTCETVQYGISFEERLSGITLEENQFIDQVGGDDIETIGINVFRILSFDNTFRRNTFDGLDKGNLAVGPCSGLFYECNVNTNVHEYDFYVKQEPISLNSFIKIDQGKINNISGQFVAAGNQFSWPGASDGSGFRNEASAPINYHYFQQSSQDPIGLTFNSNNVLADENTCPVDFVNCEFPCLGTPNIPTSNLNGIKNEFYAKRAEYHIAQFDYEAALLAGNDVLSDQKLLDMRRAREGMNEKISIILPALMRDTLTYSLDSIRTWRSNMESYEFDQINAASYLSTNQIDEALAILNTAVTKYNLSGDELNSLQIVISIYELIGQKTLYGLEKEDLDWLFEIADNESLEASGWAKNILELYGVAHYPPIYFESSSNDNKRIGDFGGNNKWKYELKVQPNPADDYIEFTWNQLPVKPHLKLYNSVGTIVWEGNVSNENNYFYLSTDFLQSGIYYYQLYSGVNIANAKAGKLIIQKL